MYDHVTDTSLLVWEAIRDDLNVVFEGAQGTLLDIDHGTYPFVTSSNPTAGGALTGTGVGPTAIDRVMGVTKAYISRVGSGPFPTELHDDTGRRWSRSEASSAPSPGGAGDAAGSIRSPFGYAVRVNGITEIALTKIDVLSHFETLKVAVAYDSLDQRYTEFPRQQRVLYNCKPVYEEVEGWSTDISGVRSFKGLPGAARAYIEMIEELSGVPITTISVGPERAATFSRDS